MHFNLYSRLGRLALAALLVVATSREASAQDETSRGPVVAVGSRVRLQSTEIAGRVTGLVAAIEDGSLVLLTEAGPPLRFRVDSLTALETSLGRQRQTLKGLLTGAVAGGLLGAALKVDPNDCGPESSSFCSRGEAVAGGALALGIIGAVRGALVQTDRWTAVSLQPTAPLRKGDRGAGVALTLSF